jgi:hypothetical protein
MAISEYDVRVSIQDVEDKTLLARSLQKITNVLRTIGGKVDTLSSTNNGSSSSNNLSIPQIKSELQSGGSSPLNVEGLLGHLAQAQSAGLAVYSSVPSSAVIQTLKSDQLVLIEGTPDTLKRVVAGAPSTLKDVNVASAGPSNMVTTDTVQTITGAKTFGTPPIGTQYNSILTGNSSNTAIVASTTAYMPISGPQIPTMSDVVAGITEVIPIAGTIKNLYVKLDTNIVGSVTITVMKNTTSTILTTTVSGATDNNHNITDTVSITAGDTLSVRIVTDGSAASCKYTWGIIFIGTI